MMPAYELMEIARIGSLYVCGDLLEKVMTPERRMYASGDEIDFDENSFNTLKRTLLLTERIDRGRLDVTCCLWVQRPDQRARAETLIGGRSLPAEGHHIIDMGPELTRSFAGMPTSRIRPGGEETVYYPIRNSDEEIVGVLEVSVYSEPFFI